jgi:hypothetical protein
LKSSVGKERRTIRLIWRRSKKRTSKNLYSKWRHLNRKIYPDVRLKAKRKKRNHLCRFWNRKDS